MMQRKVGQIKKTSSHCCTTFQQIHNKSWICCTTNPQHIEQVVGLNNRREQNMIEPTTISSLTNLCSDNGKQSDGDSQLTSQKADEKNVGRFNQRPHAVTSRQTFTANIHSFIHPPAGATNFNHATVHALITGLT